MSDPWAPPPDPGPRPGHQPPQYGGPQPRYGAPGGPPYGGPYGSPPGEPSGSAYSPYLPARPRRSGLSNTSIALVAGTVVTLLALWAGTAFVGAVSDGRRREREARLTEAAYERATDRALARAPEPLGAGRRYESRPPWPYGHGFTLTGPRGWQARSVGEWVSGGAYYDTLLDNPGAEAAVLVTRLRTPAPSGTGDAAQYVRAMLTRELGVLRGTVTHVHVAGSDVALAGVVELPDGPGRIVLFTYGVEVFRVDVAAPSLDGNSRAWRDVLAMLAGLRWD